MTHDPASFLFPDDETDDVPHALSPTAHLLDELALYGHRPGRDEPDQRPLPEAEAVRAGLAAIVDDFAALLTNTRLEDDLEDLLWSFANIFHRKIDRVESELDTNEQAQRRSQLEQDGSEIRSVELEQLTAQGISLIERRNAFEFCRDSAAECFEAATGSAWRPRSGSMVNHRALTSAVIDSREFINAKRRAETQLLQARASLSPAAPSVTITSASGRCSTAFRPNMPTWCCCMAAAPTAPSGSPRAGPTIARS